MVLRVDLWHIHTQGHMYTAHICTHTCIYTHIHTQKKKDEEFSWQSHHFPMDMRHCREWSLRKLAVAKRSLGKDVAQGGALGGGIKGYL